MDNCVKGIKYCLFSCALCIAACVDGCYNCIKVIQMACGEGIKSHNDLFKIVKEKNIDISDVLSKVRYEREKEKLQVELVKLQQWVKKNNKRVATKYRDSKKNMSQDKGAEK